MEIELSAHYLILQLPDSYMHPLGFSILDNYNCRLAVETEHKKEILLQHSSHIMGKDDMCHWDALEFPEDSMVNPQSLPISGELSSVASFASILFPCDRSKAKHSPQKTTLFVDIKARLSNLLRVPRDLSLLQSISRQ